MHSHIHMWYTGYSNATCVAMDKQFSQRPFRARATATMSVGPLCSRLQEQQYQTLAVDLVHPQAFASQEASHEPHAGGGAAQLLHDFMATASEPRSAVPGL